MGCAIMKTGEVDFADVQGLLRFGYGKMKKARYELLRVKDAAVAGEWLKAAEIANAVKAKNPPCRALHVAFTADGLRAMHVSSEVVDGFSHEFCAGMAAEARSRQLGDVDANAPANWWWGGPKGELHLVVMFFGDGDGFADFVATSKTPLWDAAFELVPNGVLDTSDLDNIEPFGFSDGISQPEIDWEQCLETTHSKFEYGNRVALGEFVLGYPNEYGKVTERPLLKPDECSAGLPNALDAPGMMDLGRHGTYMAIRQLEQDVRGFWNFAYARSGGDHDAAEKLAATMVGRNRDGTPLITTPAGNFTTMSKDPVKKDFTYDADAAGTRCPFGAHIRRANPRNSDFPNRPANLWRKLMTMIGFGPRGFRDDLISSVRFHRILRRGREYGPGLTPEDAVAGSGPREPRGIHFICLNANLSRQFEFIQNAWLAGTKFSGLSDESDPLVGTRGEISGSADTGKFTIPSENGLGRKVCGLPQFVTVRGGAYFFLPGIRGVRYIAGCSGG